MIAASPVTTPMAIHHPLTGLDRANRAPRAAKLMLEAIKAKTNAKEIGAENDPCPHANPTNPAAAIRDIAQPQTNRIATAAPIIPAPIKPRAQTTANPRAASWGEGLSASEMVAHAKAITPTRPKQAQARLERCGGMVFDNDCIEPTLRETFRIVELEAATAARRHSESSAGTLRIKGKAGCGSWI